MTFQILVNMKMNESKADQTAVQLTLHMYIFIFLHILPERHLLQGHTLIEKAECLSNIDNIEKYLFFFLDLSLSLSRYSKSLKMRYII